MQPAPKPHSVVGVREHKKTQEEIQAEEDDECNLINKDDFDEGKAKEIITSRATPVKSNALAKKNHSTIKKSQLRSPFGSNIFQDISNA